MPGQPQPGYAPPQPQRQIAMPPPPPVAALPPDPTRPKVRAVPEDAPPPPRRIVLPSPESLGIAVAPARPAVDWNQVQARLERLSIVRVQRDRLPSGGYRVILGMSAHQIEATGATEAAAVLLALERAENLAR